MLLEVATSSRILAAKPDPGQSPERKSDPEMLTIQGLAGTLRGFRDQSPDPIRGRYWPEQCRVTSSGDQTARQPHWCPMPRVSARHRSAFNFHFRIQSIGSC
ncbi:MAG: hypothetical protein DSY81_04060 [Bacillota bacterium]|nr:MAG: hypothetical protein DSY92_02950 [Planctomycetota bacterium]RUA10218.1 MAG: hypothetical protein DSY81_04060 [Bacillota bacterium]